MEFLDIQKLVELLLTIIGAAGGVVGIVELLKRFTGLADEYAQAAAWVITAVMALLAAVVSGEINPGLFADPVDALVLIVNILLGVTVASRGIYTVYKRRKAY